METNEKLIETLNGLIEINNDRVNGYEKAIEETKDLDVDLRAIFNGMASESRKYSAELSKTVAGLGGTAADGTTNSGKVYRVWMDIKTLFTGHTRRSLLEFGEDAAQKAYAASLASDAEISTGVRQLITSQQEKLKTSHDIIKKYKDLHQTVHA
jgi:uncharacterized protein (TIGR02284 family)